MGREESSILKDILPEHHFWARNGTVIKNLPELKAAIGQMDDATFTHHVNSEKNDFSEWVKSVIKDEELAKDISKTTSKEDITQLIERRIEQAQNKKVKKKVKAEKRVDKRIIKNVGKKEEKMNAEKQENKFSLFGKTKYHQAKPDVLSQIPSAKLKVSQTGFEPSEAKRFPTSKSKDFEEQKIKDFPTSKSKDFEEQKTSRIEIPSEKIEEILRKEKEIEKKEERIKEIEEKIEKKLGEIKNPKNTKFFSKEFVQGLIVGILLAVLGILVYAKFFAM